MAQENQLRQPIRDGALDRRPRLGTAFWGLGLLLMLWGTWEVIYYLVFFSILSTGSLESAAAPYPLKSAVVERSARLFQGVLNLVLGACLTYLMWARTQRWKARLVAACLILSLFISLNLYISAQAIQRQFTREAGEGRYDGPLFVWPF